MLNIENVRPVDGMHSIVYFFNLHAKSGKNAYFLRCITM